MQKGEQSIDISLLLETQRALYPCSFHPHLPQHKCTSPWRSEGTITVGLSEDSLKTPPHLLLLAPRFYPVFFQSLWNIQEHQEPRHGLILRRQTTAAIGAGHRHRTGTQKQVAPDLVDRVSQRRHDPSPGYSFWGSWRVHRGGESYLSSLR